MISSMTSFARVERTVDMGSLYWELRSVNHRYLEVTPRLPEDFRQIEAELRERAGARLRRGKVECQLRFQLAPEAVARLVVDEAVAREVVAASEKLAGLLERPAAIDPLDVLRWPGVIKSADLDLDPLRTAALEALDAALDELVQTRQREGARLRELIELRCDGIEAITAKVVERLPLVLQHQRERLQSRLDELQGELDHDRLEQEMALLANKLDVAEELDRLRTHVDEVRAVLRRDEAVGRRLDFLMQELNREANTLGSKSADVETTRASVDLKVLIEQMREQVQNVE